MGQIVTAALGRYVVTCAAQHTPRALALIDDGYPGEFTITRRQRGQTLRGSVDTAVGDGVEIVCPSCGRGRGTVIAADVLSMIAQHSHVLSAEPFPELGFPEDFEVPWITLDAILRQLGR